MTTRQLLAVLIVLTAAPVACTPASDPQPAHYDTCDEARADGATPLTRGDPGYGPHLDRDGDGTACED